MARTDFSQMQCSIARSLEVVGERWALLIIRNAFYGARRFDDFIADLGIARNVFTERLTGLVEHGVFTRERYEDRPPRYEYRLTDKGRDLLPVILTMLRWGDRWESADGPPVRLTHTTCGQRTEAVAACRHCGEELRWGELRTDPVRVRVPSRESRESPT
jgi:DNA-binding HxlR family transcriptional regulator